MLRQVSTTEGNTAKTTESAENGGSLFTYELAMPIQVQPGDMVGVEIFCPGIQPSDKLNILSLDVSESGSSSALAYKRSGSGSLLFLETSLIFREQNYLPLIEAVTGELRCCVHV